MGLRKYTDVPHMNTEISVAGVLSCNASDDTGRWTLRDVEITNVTRSVDLLEPGTDMCELRAIAQKESADIGHEGKCIL